MTPLKSRLLGLFLGFATAVGCIFYERIVSAFSYFTFLTILSVEVVCLWGIALVIFSGVKTENGVECFHELVGDEIPWGINANHVEEF